ncbi:MAG: signal peptidase I [Candidatus Moraniibacteriota bacterium]|nr:MAG: signal peptidase I [Candidatus Moranbacteria bacterium]
MKMSLTDGLTYLFYLAVAFIVLLLLSSILPIPGGVKTFVVQSGSMEPSIGTGSVVVVKGAESYAVGDVITFGPRSKTKPPTTHRILEVKEDGNFVTKGDANEEEDIRTVSRYEVIGKVIVSIPWVGYAVAAAQKPWGFAVIVVIPAVIIIWEEVGKIRGEIRKKRDYAARVEKREEKPASAGEEHNEKKEETI